MTRPIIELLEEIEEKTKELEKDIKDLRIEPNKIWLDGKVVTLWEISH